MAEVPCSDDTLYYYHVIDLGDHRQPGHDACSISLKFNDITTFFWVGKQKIIVRRLQNRNKLSTHINIPHIHFVLTFKFGEVIASLCQHTLHLSISLPLHLKSLSGLQFNFCFFYLISTQSMASFSHFPPLQSVPNPANLPLALLVSTNVPFSSILFYFLFYGSFPLLPSIIVQCLLCVADLAILLNYPTFCLLSCSPPCSIWGFLMTGASL